MRQAPAITTVALVTATAHPAFILVAEDSAITATIIMAITAVGTTAGVIMVAVTVVTEDHRTAVAA